VTSYRPNWKWRRLSSYATWYGSRPRPIVLDGDPAPPPGKGAQQPPSFSPCLLWPRSPISATGEVLLHSSRQTVFILYNGPPFCPNCPFQWVIWTHLIPWAHPSPQPKQHLERFSRRTPQSVPIIYNGPLPCFSTSGISV